MKVLKSIDLNNPPNILLLGNGLIRSTSDKSTDDFLKENWHNNEIAFEDDEIKKEPFPIRIIIGTMDSVDIACEKVSKYFLNKDYYEKFDYSLIRKFMNLNCDEILTTNYSYELEFAIDNGFLSHLKQYSDHTLPSGKRRESKYFIQSYYQISDSLPIWHIHGEAKNKTSIVIGQYYYENLLSKCIEFLKNDKNTHDNVSQPFSRKSWLESFIYGNIYIVGLRMSFAEIDLWWLLNRKKRQSNQKGSVYLFLNKNDKLTKAEKQMLRLFDVQIIQDTSEGIKNEQNYYKNYYERVSSQIKDMIESHRVLNTVRTN